MWTLLVREPTDRPMESPSDAWMSNHLHLVLRNRPDIARRWSEGEIALRWCRIFPRRDRATGEPVEPDEHDLAMVMADSERLAELRKRLASLSWFMRSSITSNVA